MLSSQLKTGLYFFSLNETSFIYFFLSTISHYRFIRIRSYNNSCLFIDLYTINIMLQHIFSNRITCQTKHINIPSAIRHVDFLHLLRNFLKSFSYRHSIPLHLYSKKKTKYNYIHRQNTCGQISRFREIHICCSLMHSYRSTCNKRELGEYLITLFKAVTNHDKFCLSA